MINIVLLDMCIKLLEFLLINVFDLYDINQSHAHYIQSISIPLMYPLFFKLNYFVSFTFADMISQMIQTVLSGTCPTNMTSASITCTDPVERHYDVIVEQIVAGNDSGVSGLCR
jgi:hypothetical protein